MSMMNRLGNCHNPYQGKAKKVLCVCSAGLLRSPTAAEVLSREPFNFNTRSCGASTEYALIPVDQALIEWADEIVCMSEEHAAALPMDEYDETPVLILNVPDSFPFRDPELQRLIAEKYTAALEFYQQVLAENEKSPTGQESP
jgi:predicted protein tyrosine phosphatase